MAIKKEVKDLCLKFVKEPGGTKEWYRLEYELTHRWKFTPFNLLVLFSKPPTIEYNEENISLVTEKEN